jgi:hypothetical protein
MECLWVPVPGLGSARLRRASDRACERPRDRLDSGAGPAHYREVIHHGAEIALLRDLYRHQAAAGEIG